jgi:phosphonatase-like hydrolase
MAIALVVFDMAGTTVRDPGAVSASFRAALDAAGAHVEPAAIDAVMGLPKPEAFRRLLAAAPDAAHLAERVDALHADFVARMLAYYAADPAVAEMPGASAAFARLRRAGVKVALNTGFSRDIVEVLLTRLGWHDAIDASIASDEVARGRPHPDMILHLMSQLGVNDARRVAKVGDTPVDLEEGDDVGCSLIIGVTNGTHTRAQLEPYPHTHLIDSLAELPWAALLP